MLKVGDRFRNVEYNNIAHVLNITSDGRYIIDWGDGAVFNLSKKNIENNFKNGIWGRMYCEFDKHRERLINA